MDKLESNLNFILNNLDKLWNENNIFRKDIVFLEKSSN